ncbi:MAG: FAD-dependent oxidoreductase [Candidatus Micrarchaeota archaeon]
MFDLVVIGGGPAGLSAALYAARKELKVVVVERGLVGGAVVLTPHIENYPGVEPVSGAELGSRMEKQVRDLGVDFKQAEVVKITKNEGGFALALQDGSFIDAKSLVFATGAEHKKLGAKGEKEFFGKGVFYCATCDAPLFKGKAVAVAGGGNTALTSAIMLADIASKVYLIHRRNELRADAILVEQAKKKGIEFLLNKNILEIRGSRFVESVALEDADSKQPSEVKVEGVLISIGVTPSSSLAQGIGAEISEKGFIKVDEKQATTCLGVFAAGDCTGKFLQVVWAAAEGALAATSAFEFITGSQAKADYRHLKKN